MTWGRLKEICGYVDSVLDKLWTVFITLGGALLTLTVVLQVFLRYVLKSPLFGLEEFSRLIGVWVYFLGAVFGTRFDSMSRAMWQHVFSKHRVPGLFLASRPGFSA